MLIKDKLLMMNSHMEYKPCRAELEAPTNNWDNSWRLVRLPGLTPEMKTFLWKLLHKILPTQDRLLRMKKSKSPLGHCQLCQDEVVESMEHALISCQFNQNVGNMLLYGVSIIIPNITSNQVLHLELDVEANRELPLVIMIGHTLESIWSHRMKKIQIQPFLIRSDLEARASMLRETRFRNAAVLLMEIIQLCFQVI